MFTPCLTIALFASLISSTVIAQPKPSPSRTVQFRLVAAETGAPMIDVELAFWQPLSWEQRGRSWGDITFRPGAIVRTDAEGFVRVKGVPTRRLIVEVRSPLLGGTFEIPKGSSEHLDLGDVEMAPTAAIQGRLLDPDGNPVEGGEVVAVKFERAEGEPRPRAFSPDPRVTVDEEGGFVLGGLQTEKAFLVGRHDSWSESLRSEPIDVRRGELVNDIVLRLRPLGRVLGSVVDAEGSPVAGAVVRVGTDDPNFPSDFVREVASEEDGSFALEAPECSIPYPISCQAKGLGLLKREVRVRSGEVTELKLELSRGALVVHPHPGKWSWIHLLRGELANPGTLRDRPEDFGVSRQLHSDEPERFESLEPGLYSVVGFSGQMPFVNGPVEVKPNEVAELRMKAPERRTLHITVQSSAGGPLSDARVQLRHLDWGRVVSGKADAQGLLTWNGMAPGDYLATVSHEGTTLISDWPVTVEAGAGEQDLRLQASGEPPSLELRLLHRGVPLSTTEVAFLSASNGARPRGTTDTEGRVTVSGLAAGPGEVRVEEAGLRAHFEVPVVQEGVVTVELPAGEILGQVPTDLFDQPGKSGLLLSSDDRTLAGIDFRREIPFDPESGAFRIENLGAGTYQLYVGHGVEGVGLEVLPLRRVTLAAGEIRDLGSIRPESTETGNLQFSMVDEEGRAVSPEGAFPVASTRDGMMLPISILIAAVYLHHEPPFQTGLIPVGEYTLSVLSPRYGAKVRPFEIRPGETTEVTLTLVSGETCRVRVTDRRGQPAPGVQISLADPSGQRLPFIGLGLDSTLPVTDRSGTTLLRRVPPGNYRLIITRGGREQMSEEIFEVKAGSDNEQTIVFD